MSHGMSTLRPGAGARSRRKGKTGGAVELLIGSAKSESPTWFEMGKGEGRGGDMGYKMNYEKFFGIENGVENGR